MRPLSVHGNRPDIRFTCRSKSAISARSLVRTAICPTISWAAQWKQLLPTVRGRCGHSRLGASGSHDRPGRGRCSAALNTSDVACARATGYRGGGSGGAVSCVRFAPAAFLHRCCTIARLTFRHRSVAPTAAPGRGRGSRDANANSSNRTEGVMAAGCFRPVDSPRNRRAAGKNDAW